MSEIVQLEIRGVGGATAREILGGPVTQTAGDRIAGFFAPNVPPAHGRQVEAYEWGKLTSGTWTSSVWWILLPFTLLNVSGWMFRPSEVERSRTDEPTRSSVWYGRLLVVGAGLAMTAVYVVWLVTLATEIVVFGCASTPECADRWYMAPISWFGGNPVWHVAVGTGIAAALILGLFTFILRTQDQLEGFETDGSRRRIGVADGRRRDTSRLRRNTPLENQGFWYKWEEHRRLFRWHLGLTLLLLGAGAGHAIARVGWQSPPANAWLGVAAIAAVVVGFVWLLSGPERFREPAAAGDPGSEQETGKRIGWTLSHVGLAAAGCAIAWAVTQSMESSSAGRFAFLDAVRALSGVLYVVAIAMLAVLVRRRIRGEQPDSEGMLWLLPGVSAALAIIVAGAGFVAIAHLVGRALVGADWVNDNGFDIVLIDILAVSVAAAVGYSVVSYLRTPRPRDAVRTDYFPQRSDGELTDRERDWVGSVAGARITATLLGGADKSLTILVAVMAVMTGVQWWTGDFALGAGADGAFAAPLFGIDGLRFLHSVSATVVVLYVFPGVQLIRANARSRDKRRQLGKVWDVLSFWPRRFHPLAAPCYAERAVPEFRDRIRAHLADDKKVIVAAHSQGTVIAFAALAQIGAETETLEIAIDGAKYDSYRDMVMSQQAAGPDATVDPSQQQQPLDVHPLGRVGLVTYGSPLSRLYGRFFAWHFGAKGTFQELRDQLAVLRTTQQRAWRSLWRSTDYIGQQVFVEPGGVLDPADPDADIRVNEAAAPLFPYDSHSNYEREPQLRATIDLFAAEI